MEFTAIENKMKCNYAMQSTCRKVKAHLLEGCFRCPLLRRCLVSSRPSQVPSSSSSSSSSTRLPAPSGLPPASKSGPLLPPSSNLGVEQAIPMATANHRADLTATHPQRSTGRMKQHNYSDFSISCYDNSNNYKNDMNNKPQQLVTTPRRFPPSTASSRDDTESQFHTKSS